ncbi:MAG: cobalamin biosynthesis protein [Deltaproteobacteria bacterium]|nr:cobalamin biosynthesis protein [Deltaproteobacteria bacterium]
MREYRKFWIALAVLALLSPLGILLPRLFSSGGAWGEWGIHEIRKMIGYAPAGMEKSADRYKAPMPDYGPPAKGDAPLARRGGWYILSGFIGIAACGGAAWLLARRLASGKRGKGR